ncbi:hypothetical protein DL771_007127 [Monosporascus sp. 5C6A]|nr:hypothetical protein DL771_007127 [Monosporascus sp. 5C6A]
MVANKSLTFKRVHETPTVAGQDIAVESREFDLDQELPSGSILVQVLYVSFDPFMKGRMVEKPVMGPYKLNEPIPNTALAKILRSNNEAFPVGALVRGEFPISQYAVTTAEELHAGWAHLIQNSLDFPLETFLAALGMPGLAAYASLYEIGKPKRGETFYVSAAAGAVGHVVGQLAKREGLRVIGSVGSDEKADYLVNELGFDAVFNYKKETVDEGLARLAPDGIDIYYDNVGGETLDAALLRMKTYGRIVACGAISQYTRVQGPYTGYGVTNLFNITVKRVIMAGYIVSDSNMGPKYGAEHMQNLSKWIAEGSFKSKSTVVDGIDNSADGFGSYSFERLHRASAQYYYEFTFIDGPTTCQPAPGIASVYPGPYLCWYRTPTTKSVTRAHNRVRSIMAEKGPFEGVMGFSQGAAVAASMILHHELESPWAPPLFRFAVFIGSPLPFSHSLKYGIDTRAYFGVPHNLNCRPFTDYKRPSKVPGHLITPDRYLKGNSDDDDEGQGRDGEVSTNETLKQIAADEEIYYQMFHSTADEVRMKIPTVHIFGRQDPWYLHSKDVLQLACPEQASVLEHCYGHEVPRHLSEEICDLIESAVASVECY